MELGGNCFFKDLSDEWKIGNWTEVVEVGGVGTSVGSFVREPVRMRESLGRVFRFSRSSRSPFDSPETRLNELTSFW